MNRYRTGGHTKYDIKYHLVWITKYRYNVLTGAVAKRAREIIRQCCERNGIEIIKGSVGANHVHILISCQPTQSPSEIARKIKGRSSKLLLDEYPQIRKRYWGRHFWARGYFCVTVGSVDEETIKKYIEKQQEIDPFEVCD